MGGAMAIRTAATYPERFGAVASFHAGGLVGYDASSPHRLLPKLSASLYVGHADHDPHMTAEQIKEFDKALAPLSIPYQVELYSGAQHHFTMQDLPAYDAEAAEKHWARLVELFKQNL
ncbi:MAG: dienelactone hydrolase family protein, partial [Proteobacteria bacterium]